MCHLSVSRSVCTMTSAENSGVCVGGESVGVAASGSSRRFRGKFALGGPVRRLSGRAVAATVGRERA
jgi:hypothetical protein